MIAPMAARVKRGYTSSSGMPRFRDSGSMKRAPIRKPTAMPIPWGEIDSGPMWIRTSGS